MHLLDDLTSPNIVASRYVFTSTATTGKIAFHDRHRTSSKNGILKAEACYLVAKVFEKHRIDTLNDFSKYANKSDLDADILEVKGQGSGIMLKYLYMLAGKSDEIKPDRHMINYVKSVFPGIKGEKDYPEIIKIIKEAVRQLKGKYPMLTERFLDVLIWDYMRSQKVWVLSVQTSLPHICTSFQDLSSTVEIYESFNDAKLAFQQKIKHYAFASNLIFNGNGKIKNLDTYLNEMISLGFDDYDEKVPEDLLTPQILSRIQNSLQLAFRGEETSFDFENTRYDDGMIGVDISEHKVTRISISMSGIITLNTRSHTFPKYTRTSSALRVLRGLQKLITALFFGNSPFISSLIASRE